MIRTCRCFPRLHSQWFQWWMVPKGLRNASPSTHGISLDSGNFNLRREPSSVPVYASIALNTDTFLSNATSSLESTMNLWWIFNFPMIFFSPSTHSPTPRPAQLKCFSFKFMGWVVKKVCIFQEKKVLGKRGSASPFVPASLKQAPEWPPLPTWLICLSSQIIL